MMLTIILEQTKYPFFAIDGKQIPYKEGKKTIYKKIYSHIVFNGIEYFNFKFGTLIE